MANYFHPQKQKPHSALPIDEAVEVFARRESLDNGPVIISF